MSFQMQFEKIRDSLITYLGSKQGTEWKTIGYPERDQSAEEINELRTVQVYYNSGDFPIGSGSLTGPVRHDMSFSIMLTIAVASTGDKDALENAETAAEYAAAAATFSSSEELADREIDWFMRTIYQTVMAANFQNLGISASDCRISNRWIGSFRKELPKQHGNFTTSRSLLTLTARTPEQIPGESVITEYEQTPFDGTNKIKDNVAQSGVLFPGSPLPED